MNIILLSKNYQNYSSGYYHQDSINAFISVSNTFVYGPGYSHYDSNDSILEVIAKSNFTPTTVDLIVCSTSWDEDESLDSVDPQPSIDLSLIKNIPKVYFLNKEYKKLDIRFQYIKKNKIDLVCTVHPNAKKWENQIGIKFLYLPFGISLNRFKNLNLSRVYDFSFSGSLHKNHTDLRFNIKQHIFQKQHINKKSNCGLNSIFKLLRPEYKMYSIFWAEWGAKNLFYQNLLPKGEKYVKLLNQTKVFLNTPSAIGIFNTRFFELMATKSLILCPKTQKYEDILINEKNCLMFNPDLSDFKEKFTYAINNKSFREKITNQALEDVQSHTYINRIKTLINLI
ncbi:MAG: hypothetical protein COB02_01920 [Candidatus Cloacimonadota bacterium]|nr:MAG: hypothetical protein COB02_01920 [Candidatus Cloacimonadota bacterium]